MVSLNNRYAIITGGSSGIGYCVAELLLKKGVPVCLVARRRSLLEEARNRLLSTSNSYNTHVDTISCDVSDSDEVDLHIGNYIKEHGAPYYLYNFAAIAYPGEFVNLPIEIFDQTIRINYLGTVYPTITVVPQMIKQGEGHIITCSSMAGLIGLYGYTAYGASKFAIKGFSDALRSELKHLGIRVSIVFPPDTKTPQLDFENTIKPEITKALTGTSKALNPEYVAELILKKVERNNYLILPGFDANLLYHLNNILGPLSYPLIDFLTAQAKNKVNRK